MADGKEILQVSGTTDIETGYEKSVCTYNLEVRMFALLLSTARLTTEYINV